MIEFEILAPGQEPLYAGQPSHRQCYDYARGRAQPTIRRCNVCGKRDRQPSDPVSNSKLEMHFS